MKWNFFQTKKPKAGKPFIFFNHEACISYGILKKITESCYYLDHYTEESHEYYQLANGRCSAAFTLKQIKNGNLIQYWAYFSLEGIGEMNVDLIPYPSFISHDQSPKNVEEEYESYTGASWEERYKKRLTPDDEYPKWRNDDVKKTRK